MPGPRTSESLYANLKQQPPPTTPTTSTFRSCGNLPRPKNSPRGCFCPAVRWTRGPGFSIPARVTFYARHLLKSAYKEKSTTSNEVVLFGDPCVHLPGALLFTHLTMQRQRLRCLRKKGIHPSMNSLFALSILWNI